MKLKIFTCLLITWMGWSQGVNGQEVMTPELLWKLHRVSAPQLSPDGTTLLFGVTVYDIEKNKGNRDLYTYNLSSKKITHITEFEGSEFNVLDGLLPSSQYTCQEQSKFSFAAPVIKCFLLKFKH